MVRFILKRILVSIPLLLGVTLITFIFIQLAPGDFLDNLRMNPNISPQVIKDYQREFHLDKNVLVQYFFWLKNIFTLNFGYSFTYKAPVIKVISSRMVNTLILSLSSMLFIWLVAIPLGIIAAIFNRRFLGKVLYLFSYIIMSIPTFLLALIFLYIAMIVGGLPLGGRMSPNYDDLNFWSKFIDTLKHLIIPMLALSLGSICFLYKLISANLLEILNSSYIVAARARGISKFKILYIHALKNALNPLITIFGYQISGLLSGAALTEIVCGWPGLGTVALKAVQSQDIYLVMGIVIITGILLIIGNLIADILLMIVDPRIRNR